MVLAHLTNQRISFSDISLELSDFAFERDIDLIFVFGLLAKTIVLYVQVTYAEMTFCTRILVVVHSEDVDFARWTSKLFSSAFFFNVLH